MRISKTVSGVIAVLAFMMQVLPGDIPTHICAWMFFGSCPGWLVRLQLAKYLPYVVIVAVVIFIASIVRNQWNNNRQLWITQFQTHRRSLAVTGAVTVVLICVGSIAWLVLHQHRINQEQYLTNQDIEHTLDRYVRPRHLSDKQTAEIAGYLKGFDPKSVRMLIPKHNKEAETYADELGKAFQQGGWIIASVDRCLDAFDRQNFTKEQLDVSVDAWCESLLEGITTNFIQTTKSAATIPPDKRVDVLFMTALRKAHVPYEGGSGGGTIAAATADVFVINVGPRRMDDWDAKAKAERRERNRKAMEEDEDEDDNSVPISASAPP
jgi:hypothetical protein